MIEQSKETVMALHVTRIFHFAEQIASTCDLDALIDYFNDQNTNMAAGRDVSVLSDDEELTWRTNVGFVTIARMLKAALATCADMDKIREEWEERAQDLRAKHTSPRAPLQ